MQSLIRSKSAGVTGGRGTAGAGPGRDLLYHVSLCDGLHQRFEAEWSSRTQLRTDVDDVLSANGVIRQPFNKINS